MPKPPTIGNSSWTIELCAGAGCVGGGAMRSFSDGTAGGYSRGGRWKVSASCAVTWSPRIPQRPILRAAVFVSFMPGTRHCDVHHGAKGGNPDAQYRRHS